MTNETRKDGKVTAEVVYDNGEPVCYRFVSTRKAYFEEHYNA